MSTAQATQGPQDAAPSAGGMPDVNVPVHPFDEVVHYLENVAYFNTLAYPERLDRPTLTPSDPQDYFGIDRGHGVVVDSKLHQFDSTVEGPDFDIGLSLSQAVGTEAGRLRGRWLFCPPSFDWQPGTVPPPVLWDPWRPQHFTLLDTDFSFGDDGFSAYGIGRTYPVTVHGAPHVMAGAVGNLTAGRGKFAGIEATFALSGEITRLGFSGYVSVRAADPQGVLRNPREIGSVRSSGHSPDASYLVMRGQKQDSTVRTEYGPPAGPNLVRLVTPAQMRSVEYRFTHEGHDGLRARLVERQVIGHLDATVTLDLLAPPGTAARPNDFTTINVYTFSDSLGRAVGTVTAQVQMGKSFALQFPQAPDQPAMRYAGYGPIIAASGQFEGVTGSVFVNSAIGINPHALSMLNVLRIIDPDGRFLKVSA